jgi:hypothetical protein
MLREVYLSESEAMDRVRDLELKYNLFDFEVEGYSIWRLLRVKATRLFQNLPLNVKPGESVWRRPLVMFRQAVWDLPGFILPHSARYLIKTCSSFLVSRECGKWKDIFFDDLFKDVDSYYKIAVQNSPGFNKKRRKTLMPISVTNNSVDLLAEFSTKLLSLCPKQAAVSEIAKCLSSEQVLQSFTAHTVFGSVNRFFGAKKVYSQLLKRIVPEYLLVSDTAEYAMCAAGHELGIKVIEFQHGVFTANHPDVMPEFVSSRASSLMVPDQMLLFGEYWKQDLDQNSFYSNKLVVVGSPRIDICRQAREASLSNRNEDNTCHMLLTSDGLANRQLIEFIIRFTEIIRGKIDYSLTIKLHPTYDLENDIYHSTFGSNDRIQIIGGTELPTTYQLLTRSDLHLSGASTCHFDALGCGVPTVLLPMPNYETLLPLVVAGHALMAYTPDDILRIASAWRDLRVATEVSHFYYKPNALVSIRRELGIQT